MGNENTRNVVFRLIPGADLKEEIQKKVEEYAITAGWITTCVGSLRSFNIRFANRGEGTSGKGFFEIVSLEGTLSINGSHLHIAISDTNGQTIGGHLLPGCLIYTTAEIVVQYDETLTFYRESDPQTGFNELKVESITKN